VEIIRGIYHDNKQASKNQNIVQNTNTKYVFLEKGYFHMKIIFQEATYAGSRRKIKIQTHT